MKEHSGSPKSGFPHSNKVEELKLRLRGLREIVRIEVVSTDFADWGVLPGDHFTWLPSQELYHGVQLVSDERLEGKQ